MKFIHFSNELPHDDLRELFRRLHVHSKNRKHPYLAALIEEATLAVRDEVRQLPRTLKTLFPPISSVLNLADHVDLRKGPLGGAVEGVLLCIVELASLIG